MSDNPVVSNSYLSNNPDIKVRAVQKSGATGPLTQSVVLDIGGSGAESLVTGANPLPVSGTITVSTISASTPYVLISAATTNATSVKASAAVLKSICVSNNAATIAYLKIYNKASAPTVGTDTPVQVYIIPGSTAGAGNTIMLPAGGLTLSTGLAFALTTGIAHTDATAVAANQIAVSLGYV